MTDCDEFFSISFEMALDRFFKAGADLSASHVSVPLEQGFAHDYLWIGSRSPKRAIFHMAGTHGVEGFVGAAIQFAALTSLKNKIIDFCASGDSAIIFLLALNPWGFKNLRRVNAANVDLNRNFLDPWSPPVASAEYVKLADWINPKDASSAFSYYAHAAALIWRYGIPTLKQALAGGQVTYPKGIYFCGEKPQIESLKFTEFLNNTLLSVERFDAIEIHSGLGDYAQNTIFSFGHDNTVRQKLSERFGMPLVDDNPTGVGIETSGDIGRWFEQRFKGRGFNWYLQEFGTYHPIRMLKALRDENAEYHHGGCSPNTKAQLLRAFCPPGRWRTSVIADGLALLDRVIQNSGHK